MSVSNQVLSRALGYFEQLHPELGSGPVKRWRAARNDWLRAQGLGGVIEDGKARKKIPPWWGDPTEFWFISDLAEKNFVNQWGNEIQTGEE